MNQDRFVILALFIALAASMAGNVYLSFLIDMQKAQSEDRRCAKLGGEMLGGKYCVKPGSLLEKAL